MLKFRNSESVNDFWKDWNIPVHKWCVRHLFKPLVCRGYTSFQASFAVFLFSAIFHEYVISIPLKMIRYWSFLAMLSQIPFGILVSKSMSGHFANICIWLSLIIGQPLAILMYYHDYYVNQALKN
jgi:diacylglycerol O-acyltransferase-1